MKLNIIKTLFVFILTLGWIGPPTVISMASIAGQSVSELIQQYYECKNLTMYLVNNSNLLPYYTRNDSIPNNSLYDSFYNKLGLANMTLDQAMAFMKKIYTDTYNCKTKFCNCVNWGYRSSVLSYYSLFLNNSNFAGLKTIIGAFNNKYNTAQYMISFSDAQRITDNGSNYPTITQFLQYYDYTFYKLAYYNNLPSFCNQNYDQSIYLDCIYFSTVLNDAYLIKPTVAQQENRMVCEFILYANCSYTEIRNYQMLVTWGWSFAKSVKFTGKSLTAYFDKIAARALNYKPKLRFLSANLFLYSDVYIHNFQGGWIDLQVEHSVWDFVCFNSSKLRIDCEIKKQPNNISIITGFKFTFFLPKGSKPSSMSFFYNSSASNLSIYNGKIFKDSKGKHIFQVLPGLLYDFNSNSYYYIFGNGMFFFAPKVLVSSANGVVVDGKLNTTAVGRRRRSVGDCVSICKEIYDQMLVNRPDDFDDLFLKNMYENCLSRCG